jgi:hypothetical protein
LNKQAGIPLAAFTDGTQQEASEPVFGGNVVALRPRRAA